ncbi:lactate racemase domain-containing protein [Polycladomyces subterraneus]|uniref:Lactate racemase domain-containing protein n=1 Tax=Polycladomyces subterraneus TaxID=1016997 RepID=A0ABT8IQS9_9BACL|nr:lactate racemase domain-containing protein [Polycladomyces subterraneus]MDN4595122.1 lactate racemase domain-containing protein [Polycladomyces subterraneus]
MGVLEELLRNVPLPRMVRVRQRFDDSRLEDWERELIRQLQQPDVRGRLSRGIRVAVAVGSRGIARIDEVTRVVVTELRKAGASPFIVPAMGSHGGATAEGQRAVLAKLGIREETVGAPILSSMEVVRVDTLPNGLPVYADRAAAEADAIVVINRIKPHTAFRAKIESGLMKMISIGLGKQKGAEVCHRLGFGQMAENIVTMGRVLIARLPIIFGVALVENAYDELCHVEVVLSEQIETREPTLLEMAKSRMPRLLFPDLDVLVIDRIGKNISGDGMDPNITGRYPTPYARGGPRVNKMVVLDLTPETGGNANGVGTADFTTQRLVDRMDKVATYANGLTSTVVAPTKIPTTLPNDRLAVQAAVKTCNILDPYRVKLVRIRDTLHLGEIRISETLLPEAERHPDVEVLSQPEPMSFDREGNFTDGW